MRRLYLINYERYAIEVLEATLKIESEFNVSLKPLKESLQKLRSIGGRVQELTKSGDQSLNRILTEAGRSMNRVLMGDFAVLPDVRKAALRVKEVTNALSALSKVKGS
ncbi:MAG: hypothetical protein DRJ26_04500 [Candidatus Methanomethylicota archaeon]|uniref:Uncharacterized protein n=1 Tax=Thermoproteota archaeon TaxID=2056631 RepID=A0A497F0Z0_9CREN|nr:MAG: hypothetical protein DRJ26_04500 [Candidatus Verstraetearchaeota archaeon]